MKEIHEQKKKKRKKKPPPEPLSELQYSKRKENKLREHIEEVLDELDSELEDNERALRGLRY